jgi:hypothetical protein
MCLVQGGLGVHIRKHIAVLKPFSQGLPFPLLGGALSTETWQGYTMCPGVTTMFTLTPLPPSSSFYSSLGVTEEEDT